MGSGWGWLTGSRSHKGRQGKALKTIHGFINPPWWDNHFNLTGLYGPCYPPAIKFVITSYVKYVFSTL